jgi:hypothetical protein
MANFPNALKMDLRQHLQEMQHGARGDSFGRTTVLSNREQLHRLRTNGPVLAQQLDELAVSAATRFRECLDRLSPQAALSLTLPILQRAPILRHCGFDTLMWLIAAGGRGDSHERRLMIEATQLFGAWVGATTLRAHFDYDPLVPVEASRIQSAEGVRRAFGLETRMAWTTEMICLELSRQVQAEREFAKELPELTPVAVTAAMSYSRNLSMLDLPWGRQRPNRTATSLLAQLAVPIKHSERLNPVEALSLGLMEQYPVVTIDGEPYPMAMKSMLFGLELPLFDLVRGRLGGSALGELYERTVRACIKNTAPPGLEVEGPVHVHPPIRDNRLETDFVLLSRGRVAVVGECKGLLPSTSAPGVVAALGQDLRKALRQVELRVGRAKQGSTFTRRGGAPLQPSSHIIGLVTPLHGYGSAAWDGTALEMAMEGAANVLPLASLLLALSLMISERDFVRYMHWRHAQMSRRLVGLDELEYLLGYLSSNSVGHVTDITVLRAYTLPSEFAITQQPLSNRQHWRELLYNSSTPA